jgi:predicted homoserine dehydrogenase-like protein
LEAIGLAHGLKLNANVGKDQHICWTDVEFSETSQVVVIRREMEAVLGKEFATRKT